MSKDLDFALNCASKTQYLMNMQSERGICFKREEGIELYNTICSEMQQIESKVEPLFPSVPMTQQELAKHKVPSRRFKVDKKDTHGVTLSADMLKKYGEENFFKDKDDHWCFKPLDCRVKDIPDDYYMSTERPFEMKDQKFLKDYLMEKYDWNPTMWNYQKDKNGKDIRDDRKQKIPTTPKFHDQGELCPNLELLGDKVDWLSDVVRYLSIKHKASLLYGSEEGKGLCRQDRLDVDGRLSATAGGVTNTWRMKHRVVANQPRPSSVYGKEIRGLYVAQDGMDLVGYDASSLEAYIKAHYCFYFDKGAYAEKISDPDFDEHTENGLAWGMMTDEDDKEGRQQTKGGTYALQYLCMPPTLAKTLGVPLSDAKDYWDIYWEINWAWKMVNDRLEEQWKRRNKKGVHCPVTGAFLHVKSANVLGSWTVQHTGAFVMDVAGCFMDTWLGGLKRNKNGKPCYYYKGHEVGRVLYYHDEYAWECDPAVSEDILALGIKSIRTAGEYLNLNVPLDADGCIGKSWADIH